MISIIGLKQNRPNNLLNRVSLTRTQLIPLLDNITNAFYDIIVKLFYYYVFITMPVQWHIHLRRAKSVSYSIHIITINVMQTKGQPSKMFANHFYLQFGFRERAIPNQTFNLKFAKSNRIPWSVKCSNFIIASLHWCTRHSFIIPQLKRSLYSKLTRNMCNVVQVSELIC